MKRSFLVTFLCAAAFLVAEVENICVEKAGDWTQNEKLEMVRKHNEKRNLVASGQVDRQPTATNMRELVWSDYLSKRASDWAVSLVCSFKSDHSPVNEGENIYLGKAGYMTVSKIIANATEDWFNEHKVFGDPNSGLSAPLIDRYRGGPQSGPGVYGHYTAMVWADITEVGCGYAQRRRGFWIWNLLVCQYNGKLPNPTNLIGGKVYKRGIPASDCASRDDEFSSLCNTPTQTFKPPVPTIIHKEDCLDIYNGCQNSGLFYYLPPLDNYFYFG